MQHPPNFEQVNVVTDLMEFDLHQLIARSEPVRPNHTKCLSYRLPKVHSLCLWVTQALETIEYLAQPAM